MRKKISTKQKQISKEEKKVCFDKEQKVKSKKNSQNKNIPSFRLKGQKIREQSVVTYHEEKESFWKKVFIKRNIIYFIILVFDIILVIYSARKNRVHYVEILGENIFIGETKTLLVGRNYITLIITVFFSCYVYALNHFFFKGKNTKKFVMGLFFFLLLLNAILFFVFTNRIY